MSHRIVLDVEGNDLLSRVTKIHCLVTKDIDSKEVRRFRAHSPVGSGESIQDAIDYIGGASLVIGHNLLGYDLGAIAKVYPGFAYKGKVFDTLVASCLIWTNLAENDAAAKKAPPALWGLHKLEAWGYRLGILKGTYGKQENAWEKWTPEMEDYCRRDVEITHKLYDLIVSKKYSETALDLEHAFKAIIVEQEQHGFRIDQVAADKLTAQLQASRLQLTEELQKVFPPKIETMKLPAYYFHESDEAVQWPTKGAASKACRELGLPQAGIKPGPARTKPHPFNPGSRDQIAARLIERYGWKPKKLTDGGKPAIDEGVLNAMPWPEAKLLSQYLVVGKTLGQLAEGENAVTRLAVNGRVHGSVWTNGAVTGRCTHSNPNIAQTPAVTMMKGADGKKAPMLGLEGGFGWEFRSIYIADEGQVLVGWDASGLELRCLAHFLARYDGGAFEKILLEGDVHTANQNAAGFYLRDSAKTFIYAFLYGAGDEKIGTVVRQDCINTGKPLPTGNLKVLGANLKARFLKNFPALGRLKEAISVAVKSRGYLYGLDGRLLHVRSDHAALNTLLQSAGALLMKHACVVQHRELQGTHGLVLHRDYAQVANIHDEIQYTCLPQFAEIVGKTGPAALQEAGKFFEFRCRLDGEWKQGPCWAATH